ncbi:MAG: succinylglutamate desuccinylase/aspartoacylase family protein [Patescibacteria group bacterium]|jgi:predicted deacylase
MQLPKNIWQLKGKNQCGPNVVVLGGTHGDELTGIEIIKKILAEFKLLDKPSGTYNLPDIKGNLFVGFGNPEAIKKQTRSASGLRDLNRSFVKEELESPAKNNDSIDLKRARELSPLLEDTDFLFDIHATSNPAPQFVCLTSYTPEYKKYLELMPIENILIDPNNVITKEYNLPEPGTTDNYVYKYGGSQWGVKKFGYKQALALCYETGFQSDLSKLDEIFFTVIRMLSATGVINDNELIKQSYYNFSFNSKQQIFKLTNCFKARYDGFVYQKNMDQGWQLVSKEQLLGKYSNGEEEYITNSGMLLFPLGANKVTRGKSLYWLAKKI